jgi:predicted short-subunit dehydrogenase-like oxidoreductase (DUF2520 family)
MTATLNIVGCGRLGKALARAWQAQGDWTIRCVLNRSLPSAERAVDFIGAGRAVASATDLDAADVTLIATGDAVIEATCRTLARAGVFESGQIVFHASGAISSDTLDAARQCGASVASAHPIKSFADPEAASADLAGTWCGMEGDESALRVLRPAVEALGMHCLDIDPAAKTLYHAGASIASNYLVTLVDSALRCYELAGVPRDVGAEIVATLIFGTASNVSRLGPAAALTGPVARGEVDIVAGHLDALDAADADLAQLYRALAIATLHLARTQGTASEESLRALATLLAGPHRPL